MNNIIAITIGDINGIGINILLNCFRENKIKNFVLFTNVKILEHYIKKNNIKIKINIYNKDKENFTYVKNSLNIYNYSCNSSNDNTYKSLRYSYKLCKNKLFSGIITLPLRKDLIKNKINKNFIGHTEFFQKIDKKKYSNMLLFHNKIIVSPLTTHIPINKINKFIYDKKFLYSQIKNLNQVLKLDFSIKIPKLIISGLNPHAGEKGSIGTEELNYIIPTIKKLKKEGLNIAGPFSADSLILNNNLKKYDCFIFMYHDQALIPFKYISKFSGVNYTGNLDIIRVSPDHGTAYDLIGSKNISYKSFLNCFKLVMKISKNRIKHAEG